jgi:metal-responsive CopG/Arc/MetJ family transcriptional regulator
MSTTITVRTGETLRRELQRRARAGGKTLSELIREILEAAVAERRLDRRAGHLKGRLRLPRRGGGSWRERLRERNWRA